MDEDVTRECLSELSLSSTHMHQSSLASSLLDRVNAIFRASKDDKSEWTTKGKRRKHNRKRPMSSASTVPSKNDGDPSDDEGSEETNELDHDHYYGLINNDLKDILRARGLKAFLFIL